MKRLISVAVLLVLVAGVTCPASADMQVQIYDDIGNGNGGAFNVYVRGTESVGVYAVDKNFQSFCVETNEYFNLGGTYSVLISPKAVYNEVKKGEDPLDPRTAYLYSKWLGIDGFGPFTHNATIATDVQKAIWYIENEAGGVNNAYVTEANTAVLPTGAWYVTWGDTGPTSVNLGHIRVLNVFTLGHASYESGWNYRQQDQLVQVPSGFPGQIVPVPAAVVLGGKTARNLNQLVLLAIIPP